MALVNKYGSAGKSTMDSGRTISWRVTAPKFMLMERHMMVSSQKTKFKATACINGLTAGNTQVSGNKVSNMAMESTLAAKETKDMPRLKTERFFSGCMVM